MLKFLNQIPIFDSLTSEDLRILIKFLAYTKLPEGTVLFEENEDADLVFFVVSGALDVIKQGEGTKSKVIISVLRRGCSVGEMGLIEKRNRSATIRAKKDSTLIMISRNDFEAILTDYPWLGIKILKGLCHLLSQNLRKTSSRLADYMLPMT